MIDVKAIWAQVKANQAVLAACPGPHDFVLPEDIRERARCQRCGGLLDRVQAYWYLQGLKDGKR